MNFKGKILLQPSFHNNLEIILTNKTISIERIPKLFSTSHLESKDKLSVLEYKHLKKIRLRNEHEKKIKWKESCNLDLEDLNRIPLIMEDLANNKEIENQIILDGIIGDCEIKTESNLKHFKFHSPNNSMRSYHFINLLINLCFKKFKSNRAIEAIEQVETYFGFCSPWKITNVDPFTCRIYGSLSTSVQDDLNKFIEGIINQDKLIMDLLNFEGMGTILYDTFRILNSGISEISWLVKKENERVINQLLEIGIVDHKIIKT